MTAIDSGKGKSVRGRKVLNPSDPLKNVGWRLPESLIEHLNTMSLETGRPMSGLVREALVLGLEDMVADPERAKSVRLSLMQKGE